MKSKQILDAFSETLMRDERILSPRERELLTSLLQNAKAACHGNEQIQTSVMSAISRGIGETVAQRAFTLLGSSIVEQIVSRGLAIDEKSTDGQSAAGRTSIWAGPQPPTAPKPVEPEEPAEEPTEEPVAPDTLPSGPQPPTMSMKRSGFRNQRETARSGGSVSVLEATDIKQARCVVLDEFLSPQELNELIRYTLEHEREFVNSEVVSPSGEMGVTDYSHRRSRVLMEPGPHGEVILNRIRCVLPHVLAQLGMDEFPITRTEAQITASNDGDFFRAHCDDGQKFIASRHVTFVYFFHREPRQFTGGDLRLHDSLQNDKHADVGSYETIVPQQNQIVFFPCSTLHEITPVQCNSGAFADSRFTVNGWLHR